MQGLFQFVKSNFRWLAGGLLLTVFSSFGQTFYISLFSKQIRKTFDLTDGNFGTIYMIATLASAVSLVWVGKLVDRYPVSKVAFVVMLFLSLACVGMSMVSSVAMLLVVIYALRLFGQGMMTHTSQTAMGRWYSAERGRAISLTAMGHQVGEAILPSLVLFLMLDSVVVDDPGVLVEAGNSQAAAGLNFGWRKIWQLAAIAVIVALPVVMLLMRVERQPQKVDVDQDGSNKLAARDWTRPEVLRDPAFWGLCVGILAPAFIGTSVFFHSIHLTEIKGWSPQVFASSFLVLSITTVMSTLVAGWLVDRFNSKRLLPTFLLPMAVGCLLLGTFSATWVIFAFMFLLGLSYGLSSSVFGTIWPETYGIKHLGSIRSVAISAMVFASALGPGLTGRAIDLKIGFEFQLILMAGYSFGAAALMVFVSRNLLSRTET